MVRNAGRLLARYLPALVAWFLAGELARYLFISTAAYVSQTSVFAATLLVEVGVLTKLISLVAMFLVMRPGLGDLNAIAPAPDSGPERRRFFVDALLSAIVPFFLFYQVWGYLHEDWVDFAGRSLDIWIRRGGPGDAPAVGSLALSPLTITTAVIAFVAVSLWRRYQDKLPNWTAIPAVLFEMMWAFLLVTILGRVLDTTMNWIQSRRLFEWFDAADVWLKQHLKPVAWLWDAVLGIATEIGGLIALPFAWLIIAGSVYGVALESASGLVANDRRVERIKRGWSSAPKLVRTALSSASRSLIDRLEPIWSALGLMFRAGPLVVFGYVLLYTVTLFLEQALLWAIIRAVGPHDLMSFWRVADTALFLLIPMIVTPVQLALIASAYDRMLKFTRADTPSETGVEPEELGRDTGDLDVQGERSGSVGGKHEGNDQLKFAP